VCVAGVNLGGREIFSQGREKREGPDDFFASVKIEGRQCIENFLERKWKKPRGEGPRPRWMSMKDQQREKTRGAELLHGRTVPRETGRGGLRKIKGSPYLRWRRGGVIHREELTLQRRNIGVKVTNRWPKTSSAKRTGQEPLEGRPMLSHCSGKHEITFLPVLPRQKNTTGPHRRGEHFVASQGHAHRGRGQGRSRGRGNGPRTCRGGKVGVEGFWSQESGNGKRPSMRAASCVVAGRGPIGWEEIGRGWINGGHRGGSSGKAGPCHLGTSETASSGLLVGPGGVGKKKAKIRGGRHNL